MVESLSSKISYVKALKYLQFDGTRSEVRQLKELLKMVASVPAGRQILEDIIAKRIHSKISFVSEFANKRGNISPKGRFYRDNKTIGILKIDTNLLDMSEKSRLRSKIMMATVLSHELQHCADVFKNRALDCSAADVNESVLATVLCEMHAYMVDYQVDKELRAKYGMLDKIIIDGKEYTESVKDRSPHDRTEAMKNALAGKNSKIKWYMDETRKREGKRKRHCQCVPAAVFRSGVVNYLKEMKVSMSFEEAMACLMQSVKLLPSARSCPKRRDR